MTLAMFAAFYAWVIVLGPVAPSFHLPHCACVSSQNRIFLMAGWVDSEVILLSPFFLAKSFNIRFLRFLFESSSEREPVMRNWGGIWLDMWGGEEYQILA